MYPTSSAENACEQVTIGFSFTSDWLKKWRELFELITNRSKAEPNQSGITLDVQLKTAVG